MQATQASKQSVEQRGAPAPHPPSGGPTRCLPPAWSSPPLHQLAAGPALGDMETWCIGRHGNRVHWETWKQGALGDMETGCIGRHGNRVHWETWKQGALGDMETGCIGRHGNRVHWEIWKQGQAMLSKTGQQQQQLHAWPFQAGPPMVLGRAPQHPHATCRDVRTHLRGAALATRAVLCVGWVEVGAVALADVLDAAANLQRHPGGGRADHICGCWVSRLKGRKASCQARAFTTREPGSGAAGEQQQESSQQRQEQQRQQQQQRQQRQRQQQQQRQQRRQNKESTLALGPRSSWVTSTTLTHHCSAGGMVRCHVLPDERAVGRTLVWRLTAGLHKLGGWAACLPAAQGRWYGRKTQSGVGQQAPSPLLPACRHLGRLSTGSLQSLSS